MPYSYDRYLGIFYTHYEIHMETHGWTLVNPSSALVGQVDKKLIEFHLSETNRSCKARAWTACLKDRDANHYAISPPPEEY